ncbi:MAG TPA: NADP-dependent isocitrate dehydrogenase [Candidatus Kapabacteria bacterium]|nr:NADP-dependent isocitrate dehydrogenase [Candidatus Kapabacteria bacterium]HYM34546.1 NADP-dependent isocitrate dehydrogenase [Steroidobacteraceae bacterium]
MPQKTPITIAYGDGIGPEIMSATLSVLEAAGAALTYDVIEIGEKVYKRGVSTGIDESSWDILRKNKVFLKAPITTPQGGGVKSLNVTVRKTLGLYANVRPCAAYAPYIHTKNPRMDLIIIRENEEDLYAGIEHQQTAEVVQALKLISRPGSEKIVHYAFEYARAHNRKKVTCITKDNIMKLTDGLFHKVFNEIAIEYPEIEHDHYILDIGSAFVAEKPEMFDVIVTLNLYGDVISDIAAQVAGSVGIAGSANIGEDFAMFEAIHGSAPTIAGKNIANPSGLLQGAIQMLVHIGQPDVAATIANAWLLTIEHGIHTKDIYSYNHSHDLVGTKEFADAVIARLGKLPEHFKVVSFSNTARELSTWKYVPRKVKKETIGVDVFLDSLLSPNELAKKMQQAGVGDLHVQLIANRGVKVWPEGMPETFLSDHYRCRFRTPNDRAITHSEIIALLTNINTTGLDFIKTENLCTFDGELGFSLGQGE